MEGISNLNIKDIAPEYPGHMLGWSGFQMWGVRRSISCSGASDAGADKIVCIRERVKCVPSYTTPSVSQPCTECRGGGLCVVDVGLSL